MHTHVSSISTLLYVTVGIPKTGNMKHNIFLGGFYNIIFLKNLTEANPLKRQIVGFISILRKS